MRDAIPHGTRRRYQLGCRCSRCHTAQITYLRAWRQARTGQPPRGRLAGLAEANQKRQNERSWRLEEYTWLRAAGVNPEAAAGRVGVTQGTARHYEAERLQEAA